MPAAVQGCDKSNLPWLWVIKSKHDDPYQLINSLWYLMAWRVSIKFN